MYARITALALSLVLVLAVTTVYGQLIPAKSVGGGPYYVEYGNTLYELFGPDWKKLLPYNPGLKHRITVDAEGREIVMLYPFRGDVLFVPDDMQIRQRVKPAVVPPRKPDTLSALTAYPTKASVNAKPEPSWTRGLAVAILILGAVIAVVVWFINRAEKAAARRRKEAMARWKEEETDEQYLKAAQWISNENSLSDLISANAEQMRLAEQEFEASLDPELAGPPVIEGGFRPFERVAIRKFFDRQAAELGKDLGVVIRRVTPVEYGLISGSGRVGFADRTSRVFVFDKPREGYRAFFQIDGGEEMVEMMALEGCMNPCSRDEGLIGFGFEPRPWPVRTPAPQATVESEPLPDNILPFQTPGKEKKNGRNYRRYRHVNQCLGWKST